MPENKSKLRVALSVIAAFLAVAGFTGCSQNGRAGEDGLRRTFTSMNTVVELYLPSGGAYGGGEQSAPLSEQSAADLFWETVTGLEAIYSLTAHENQPGTSDGILRRINAGEGAIEAPPEVLSALREAIEVWRVTGGAFDPALGRLIELWDIGGENFKPPGDGEVAAATERRGGDNISVGDGSVTLSGGVWIDPGAWVKGYSAGVAADVLKQSGAADFIFSLGGNVACRGTNSGKPWRIGLRDPAGGTRNIGILTGTDLFAVTSGMSERYSEYGGKRYGHILSPFDGYPVDNGVLSVTVILPCDGESPEIAGLWSDALSTALFVMGLSEAKRFIAGWDREDMPLEVIIVTEGYVYITPGLADCFELTAKEYKLMTLVR